MRRSRCRAKGGVGGGYTPPIQDYFTRHAGKCAAADPEGFAHSAAAGGKSIAVEEHRQRAGYGRDGGRIETLLWL